MKNRWLKRRDAEQQSAVIRNLTEHNKQLWEALTVANAEKEAMVAVCKRLRDELRKRGVVA